MSAHALRHERPSGQFSKSRGLHASISFFLPSPTPPHYFTHVIFRKGLRGCLHEKTHTSTSFILGWLFDFLLRLHDDRVISITLFEGTLHVDKIHVCLKIANITYALPVPVYRQTNFNTETGGPFTFTWYHCKISYWSEILALVQQPRWTHAGVTRAGITFCGGIT